MENGATRTLMFIYRMRCEKFHRITCPRPWALSCEATPNFSAYFWRIFAAPLMHTNCSIELERIDKVPSFRSSFKLWILYLVLYYFLLCVQRRCFVNFDNFILDSVREQWTVITQWKQNSASFNFRSAI